MHNRDGSDMKTETETIWKPNRKQNENRNGNYTKTETETETMTWVVSMDAHGDPRGQEFLFFAQYLTMGNGQAFVLTDLANVL